LGCECGAPEESLSLDALFIENRRWMKLNNNNNRLIDPWTKVLHSFRKKASN
jgi:hypothetical protein